MTIDHKNFVEDVGRCELCGSRRNLQLHHIIPLVCAPLEKDNLLQKPINLDIEDNWLCVCGSCHSKLTPKNLLVKYGQNKTKMWNNHISEMHEVYGRFCEYILENGDGLRDVGEWFDAVGYACGIKNNKYGGTVW